MKICVKLYHSQFTVFFFTCHHLHTNNQSKIYFTDNFVRSISVDMF